MHRPKRTKKDINHSEIVNQCRELGMVVWDTADLGGGVLDLVVFWRGRCLPVEIKANDKSKFTESEVESIDKLNHVGIVPIIAYSIDDIVRRFEC